MAYLVPVIEGKIEKITIFPPVKSIEIIDIHRLMMKKDVLPATIMRAQTSATILSAPSARGDRSTRGVSGYFFKRDLKIIFIFFFKAEISSSWISLCPVTPIINGIFKSLFFISKDVLQSYQNYLENIIY